MLIPGLEQGFIPRIDFLCKVNEEYVKEYKHLKDNKGISYINIPAAFDIETYSFYEGYDKKCTMYIWQFGIENHVTYGRTWKEFKAFIELLSKVLQLNYNHRLVVYVHNLSYEFQFIRKRFKWKSVFLTEERKPLYAITTNGIEFRCSYKLSSKSLSKVGEDLHKYKFSKAVGDLDYTIARNSKTPLNSKELNYCELDIRVLIAYIQEKIEDDGGIINIPLTNTGYVRRYCKKKCYENYLKYRDLMEKLTLLPGEYLQLKRAFQGGFTHASSKYSGKEIKNVTSYDFTSSYPAVMLSEKFPMSCSTEIKSIKDDEELFYYLKNYCCLFNVTFYDIEAIVDYDHPISISKCTYNEGVLTDNGRVVLADKITTTCTEQDYITYLQFYKWSKVDISEFRIYKKDYLPTPLVKAILELYKQKTVLKGIDSEYINYMISKNMLNAAYGMTVTDIVRDELIYEDDYYSSTEPNIEEVIDKYNNSKNRFLFYPWGVWVTAYARTNLFTGILACADDYIYSDTDSIKILNGEKHLDYIEKYNKHIAEKLKLAAEYHKIDPSEFSPKNKDGEEKPLGVWEFDGKYQKFKTLGAKRYLVQKKNKKGEIDYSLTVAGLSKSKGINFLKENFQDPFKGFKDHLVVPSKYSGRLTLTYFDDACRGTLKDYLGNEAEYEELSYIHMEPSNYELSISIEYRLFLKWFVGLKSFD